MSQFSKEASSLQYCVYPSFRLMRDISLFQSNGLMQNSRTFNTFSNGNRYPFSFQFRYADGIPAVRSSKLACTGITKACAIGLLALLLTLIPNDSLADAGYSNSQAPVITPSSSSQVIQPPAGSASPNSGFSSPVSSTPSNSKSSGKGDSKKSTGLESNPIQPPPELQARPDFVPRL